MGSGQRAVAGSLSPLSTATEPERTEKMQRRVTRREHVVDDYHGVKVADPYRWLEKDTDPEVAEWIDGQNEDFQKYIADSPARAQLREELRDRLKELWHHERCGPPEYVNGHYFAWRNDGLQNQSVLYRLKSLGERGEAVLDPNKFSEDGTVAVMSAEVSPSGRYLAYGLSASGSDWQEIKVLDLAALAELPDVVRHTRFTGMAWLPDESGFIYTRYPEPPKEVMERNTLGAFVCLHRLGQQQADDAVVHKDPAHPDWGFNCYMDEGKKWLFMRTWNSTLPVNQLHYKPVAALDSPWVAVSDNFDNCYDVLGVADDTAYIYTEKDAPFGKIASLPLRADGFGEFRDIVPDQGKKLAGRALAGGRILCAFLSDVVSQLFVYELSGALVREIELPGPGSITALAAKQARGEFFLQFTSFLYPATVFRCDAGAPEMSAWFSPKINFPFGEYETVQEFYASKDGTKIPMFITRKKGLAGKSPALLYGYGGFNISMSPSFTAQRLPFLERGGVYAVACIRGGDEYGEAWHRAGMLENKQNCFDDFVAAGEHLCKQGYASKERLAIMGGSNGGLLAAACLTQRPDAFGAAVVAVPVVDMLRYHLFTAGRFWTGEYGSSENEGEFRVIYKYSPLHNVKMNAAYPPTLIMTADTDDRVVPGQARKFAATLQAADAGDSPILIRIEKSAGHGHGKPIAKLINEAAELYTFVLSNVAK